MRENLDWLTLMTPEASSLMTVKRLVLCCPPILAVFYQDVGHEFSDDRLKIGVLNFHGQVAEQIKGLF